MNRKEFMESLRQEMKRFARMQPESSEEVIFYLSKAKMILEAHTTCVRLLEKEPNVAEACMQEVLKHIQDYVDRYHKEDEDDEDPLYQDVLNPKEEDEEEAFDFEEDEDPWLEGEVDQDDEDVEYEDYDSEDFPCITLTDQDTGEARVFYHLDTILLDNDDEDEEVFLAIIPVEAEDEEEEGGVRFLRIMEEYDDSDDPHGVVVTDEALIEQLFEIFKEENFDRFHFED